MNLRLSTSERNRHPDRRYSTGGNPVGRSSSWRVARRFAAVAAGAVLSTGIATTALAQDSYPAKPLTIVVPWGPGGSGDITARTFGRYFEKKLGQAAVIENKPGAGGIIGTQFVKAAAPDGYTVMMASNMTHAANSALYKKLPYDPMQDFRHVGMFGVFGLMALVPANSPFKSVPELIAYAKAHPDQVTVGYSNTSTQICAALLKVNSGLPIKEVGYKTIGNAFTDVLGGHIQVLFADYVAAASHIASGSLVPIAVTTARRSDKWPEVPALAEFYPGYEVVSSLGLAAPAATPQPVVEKLNAVMREALQDAEVKAQLEKLGYTLRPESLEGTRGFMTEEGVKWAKYIKAANIEPQ